MCVCVCVCVRACICHWLNSWSKHVVSKSSNLYIIKNWTSFYECLLQYKRLVITGGARLTSSLWWMVSSLPHQVEEFASNQKLYWYPHAVKPFQSNYTVNWMSYTYVNIKPSVNKMAKHTMSSEKYLFSQKQLRVAYSVSRVNLVQLINRRIRRPIIESFILTGCRHFYFSQAISCDSSPRSFYFRLWTFVLDVITDQIG